MAALERELTVKTVCPHQKRLLVSFEEVPDRTAADSLRGMKFFAEPLEREEASDEYYNHELIWLRLLRLSPRLPRTLRLRRTKRFSLFDEPPFPHTARGTGVSCWWGGSFLGCVFSSCTPSRR